MNRKNDVLISFVSQLLTLLDEGSDIFWRDRPWTHIRFADDEVDELKKTIKSEKENQHEIMGLCLEILEHINNSCKVLHRRRFV